MRPLTSFQEGLIKIMALPDTKEVKVVTRKRSNFHDECPHSKDGPVAKFFRERFKWDGPLSLKAMGKQMWSEYNVLRYHYRKFGNFNDL